MAKKVSRFHRIRASAQALLDEQALRSRAELSNWHRFLHFWVVVGKSFIRNRCPVRASALAYTTVLALIPMLAVAVGITSVFLKKEGEDRIDQFIAKLVASVTPPAVLTTNSLPSTVSTTNSAAETEGVAVTTAASISTETNEPPAFSSSSQTNAAAHSFAEAKETVRARHAVARSIHQFIRNTRSGTLGVTGSVLLIFVAISMLSRIEDAFNDIWGIARGRSWFMRVVLYWGVLTLVPLLLIVALGLATGPHLQASKRLLVTMPFVGHFLAPVLFQILPIAVLCLTFALFYVLMPNTKVRWQAATVGGAVASILLHLNNMVSVLYVSRVVSNSRIYGSLGLVPVFMIGLYFAWIILLFGAQVAYVFQNRASYREEKQIEQINQRGREFVALRLMTGVGRRFMEGESPPGVVEIAEDLAVPTRLVQQITQTLAAARLIVETGGTDPAYVPARPLETITCHDILLALRASQGQELATRDEPTRAEVYGEFHRIQEAERRAASSMTLLALVTRAQAQLRPSEAPREIGQANTDANETRQ
jgi:membrane protein